MFYVTMLQNTCASIDSFGVQPLVYKAYYCQHQTSKIILCVYLMLYVYNLPSDFDEMSTLVDMPSKFCTWCHTYKVYNCEVNLAVIAVTGMM